MEKADFLALAAAAAAGAAGTFFLFRTGMLPLPFARVPARSLQKIERKGRGLTTVSDRLVRDTLTVEEAISVNRAAFIALAQGRAVVPERIVLPAEHVGGCSLFKPCSLVQKASSGDVGARHQMGMKIVSVRPKNAELEEPLPTVPAKIFMLDDITGYVSAILDATYLTALRTAAGSAVATDLLAKPEARVLTVFGAGLQGDAHVRAMLAVRPNLELVFIANRTMARAQKLATAFGSRYPSTRFVALAFADIEEVKNAVNRADIICTATGSETPVFKGNWVTSGTHINAVGSYRPESRELDSDTVKKCYVIVDSEHAMPVGDLDIPMHEGVISRESHFCGSLGELLVGESVVPINENTSAAQSCTLFKSVGTSVQDIATAAAVLERLQNSK